MLLKLKVIAGIIRNDLISYVEAYKMALAWAKMYPDVDPLDFKNLQDRAWQDLESDLKAELAKDGISFRDLSTEVKKEGLN